MRTGPLYQGTEGMPGVGSVPPPSTQILHSVSMYNNYIIIIIFTFTYTTTGTGVHEITYMCMCGYKCIYISDHVPLYPTYSKPQISIGNRYTLLVYTLVMGGNYPLYDLLVFSIRGVKRDLPVRV